MPKAYSVELPPRYVEYARLVPSAEIFETNASFDPVASKALTVGKLVDSVQPVT